MNNIILSTTWYFSLSSFLFTYLIHSSVLILVGLLFLRFKVIKSNHLKIQFLRIILFGGVLTTSLVKMMNLGTPVMYSSNQINLANVKSSSEVAQTSWFDLDMMAYLFCIIYLGLALIFLSRFLLKRYYFFHQVKAKIIDKEHRIYKIFSSVCQNSQIRKPIKLYLSANITSPMVYGTKNIYLPQQVLDNLNDAQIASLLAHELTHLLRKDDWWLIAYHTFERIFFIQPLNARLRKKIQVYTEEVCDAQAIIYAKDKIALAECLVAVASWMKGAKRPQAFIAQMAIKKSQLAQRVELVLNFKTPEQNKIFRSSLFLLAVVGLATTLSFVLPNISTGNESSLASNTQSEEENKLKDNKVIDPKVQKASTKRRGEKSSFENENRKIIPPSKIEKLKPNKQKNPRKQTKDMKYKEEKKSSY